MDNYNNFNNNGYQQGYPQQNSGYGQAPQQGYNMNKTQPISGWSWGAFMFNVAWGIGNKCYLPLLCFVPVLNIIWIFILQNGIDIKCLCHIFIYRAVW